MGSSMKKSNCHLIEALFKIIFLHLKIKMDVSSEIFQSKCVAKNDQGDLCNFRKFGSLGYII